MNLLVVESPIKARTIRKHLPAGEWQVLATGGHVRDLSNNGLGIYFAGGKNREVLFDFKEISARRNFMDQIRAAAGSASSIYLGTDPDREGEAIAWHVSRMLGSASQSAQRICFNAVTGSAIRKALETPRSINMAIVNASLARRAVDRIIGYKVSPLATAALKTGTSDRFYGVGRVQAGVLAILQNQGAKSPYAGVRRGFGIQASYTNGLKASCSSNFSTRASAQEAIGRAGASGSSHYLTRAKREGRTIQTSPPLTTAGMIRAASKLMGWTTEKTMTVAQELYYGGRITYPRTDCVATSDEGDALARSFILEKFGRDYLGENAHEAGSPFAQEAHECIRPTQIAPFSREDDGATLLSVIQACFIASHMSASRVVSHSYEIHGEGFPFQAEADQVLFDGHLRMLPNGVGLLKPNGPFLDKAQLLDLKEALLFELRDPVTIYDEAALVTDMEAFGVGRPSTYASTISNIFHHGYVFRSGRGGHTEQSAPGRCSIDFDDRGTRLIEWLHEKVRFVSEPGFSREVEEALDRIERAAMSGILERDTLIREVYERVDEALKQSTPDSSPALPTFGWESFHTWGSSSHQAPEIETSDVSFSTDAREPLLSARKDAAERQSRSGEGPCEGAVLKNRSKSSR